MAFNFPDGATNGQKYTATNGLVYIYNGQVWLVENAGTLSSFDSKYAVSGSYETTGRGILSGSISYSTLTNIPLGIVSASSQVLGGSNIYSSSTQLPNGLISGSGQLTEYETTGRGILSGSILNLLPTGIVSGSSQVLGGSGVVSGSYETTGRGIISSSAQLTSLGYLTNGGNVTFNSVTANQYIVSSSVYYVTQSYSSGSTIFGNTTDDTHQFTGSVLVSGSLNITGNLNIPASASLNARLWQLHDVNDTASGSIPNGYQLAWNGSTSIWEPTAGATAKGSIRLYMATNRSNASGFYFNANTRTASDSASPSSDTAFMVTTNLLNKVTVYLRQDGAGPNSTQIAIYKNADGVGFSSATLLASSSLSLTQNTTQIYTFTGLSISTFDSLHVYCDPTSTPGTLYAIVTVE